MMCLCSTPSVVYEGEAVRYERLTRLDVDGGIFWVGDGEGKLGADVPALGRGLLFAIVEVNGDHVVRLAVGIAHRKEQDVPMTASHQSPFVVYETTRWTDHLCPPHSNEGERAFLSILR